MILSEPCAQSNISVNFGKTNISKSTVWRKNSPFLHLLRTFYVHNTLVRM